MRIGRMVIDETGIVNTGEMNEFCWNESFDVYDFINVKNSI